MISPSDPTRITYASDVTQLISPADLAGMSGLDFLEAMLDGRLPAPPISQTLGFTLDCVNEGEVVFRGRPSFDVLNPLGAVHGGWFGTLLDSCMACAVQSKVPAGQSYTTLEFKVSILRPLFASSGEVLATGKAVHVGRRTGSAEGRIVGAEDGKIYATGSTTCIVMDIP